MALFSPEILTRRLHSRPVAVAMALFAVAGAAVFQAFGLSHPLEESCSPVLRGPIFSPGGFGGYILAMLTNLGVAAFLLFLNKKFNLLRSHTSLFAGFFMLMQLATPDVFCHFGIGLLLCLTVLGAMAVMYASYSDLNATLAVFTVFMVLSGFVALQYAFLLYIPVFLLACGQMRIFSLRTVLAAIIGMVTPWWLLFGFGLIHPQDIELPRFAGWISMVDFSEMMQLAITVGFTVLLTVVSIAMNMLKTIAYNAQARAVNGVVMVVSLVTIVALLVDFTHLSVYIPLLNCCAALAVAHYFSAHASQRSCFGIILFITIYILLFIWRTVI